MKESYERAKKNSIGSKSVRAKRYAKRIVMSALFIAGLSSISTIGVIYLKERINLTDAVSEYRTIVNDCSARTDNNEHYWFDEYEIAQRLGKSFGEVEDDDLFGVYCALDDESNKIEHMNKVLDGLGIKKSFDSYVCDMGFEKNGKADYDKYEKIMTDYLIAKSRVEEAQEGVIR